MSGCRIRPHGVVGCIMQIFVIEKDGIHAKTAAAEANPQQPFAVILYSSAQGVLPAVQQSVSTNSQEVISATA